MSLLSVDRVQQVRMANSSRKPEALTVQDDAIISAGQNQVQTLYGNDNVTVTPAMRSSFAMTTRRETISRYYGFWGSMTVKTTLIYLGDTNTSRRRVITENTVSISSTFLNWAVIFFFGASLASVPRTLRVYRIVHWRDIVDRSGNGDVKKLQDAFADGILSPFVMTKDGWTLLHVGVFASSDKLMLISDLGSCYLFTSRFVFISPEIRIRSRST